jgi:hypothetical protein
VLTASEKLMAMDEIRQLKSRYFRYMDTKDWEGLPTIFCKEAIFDLRAGLTVDAQEGPDHHLIHGREEIARIIRGGLIGKVSVHHGHCHEVTVDSAEEARGVIAMVDIVTDAETGDLVLEGYGHYHETYRWEDGAWRVWRSRLSRLKVATNLGYVREEDRPAPAAAG